MEETAEEERQGTPGDGVAIFRAGYWRAIVCDFLVVANRTELAETPRLVGQRRRVKDKPEAEDRVNDPARRKRSESVRRDSETVSGAGSDMQLEGRRKRKSKKDREGDDGLMYVAACTGRLSTHE